MKNKWLARFLAVALVASVLWEPMSIVSATDALGIPEASEAVQGEGGEESILNSEESSLDWDGLEAEDEGETSESENPETAVGEREDSGQEEAPQDEQNAENAGGDPVSEEDVPNVISSEEVDASGYGEIIEDGEKGKADIFAEGMIDSEGKPIASGNDYSAYEIELKKEIKEQKDSKEEGELAIEAIHAYQDFLSTPMIEWSDKSYSSDKNQVNEQLSPLNKAFPRIS